jgi:hypothetical protein
VESLLAQSVLVILLLAALIWTFGIEPRRRAKPPGATNLKISQLRRRSPALRSRK